MACGADHLIFACNTSHAFVQDVFRRVPEAEEKTVHIIDTLARRLCQRKIRSAYLIASEGTLQSNIYQQTFDRYGISLDTPDSAGWSTLREFIEMVKQNQVGLEEKVRFREFCAGIPCQNIILGCTEFPVLLSACELENGKTLWDPLDSAIDHIKSIIK